MKLIKVVIKCKGGDSDLCDTCYRRTALEKQNQPWFPKVPLYDNGKCEEYWSEENARSLTSASDF